MFDAEEMRQAIIDGDTERATRMVEVALKGGTPAVEILNTGLVPGIRKVGDLFSAGEYFLPDLIVSGEAMSASIALLEPELKKTAVKPAGKVAIGTVQGDVHDIGKNIVIMMLKGNGWIVDDLGVDVPPAAFCEAVAKGDYDILGMSTLLTMTARAAEETIRELEKAGLRKKVKVMVGGAPVTKEWADKIGADGFATDASLAVKLAANLVSRD